jgi:hypothetical protein
MRTSGAVIFGANGKSEVVAMQIEIVCEAALEPVSPSSETGRAGAILSVDYTQTWANEMTKRRGFVAVGLVIVARSNPNLVLPVVLRSE